MALILDQFKSSRISLTNAKSQKKLERQSRNLICQGDVWTSLKSRDDHTDSIHLLMIKEIRLEITLMLCNVIHPASKNVEIGD